MTIQEAQKLKWGTVLRPSPYAKRTLKEYREGLFLGLNRDKSSIVVLPMGIKTANAYHPSFWMTKAEVL